MPVLTLERHAAMLLRVKAFAAVSKQPRRDFASDEDERLGGRGGGGGRTTSIRKNTVSFGSSRLHNGGGDSGGPSIVRGSRGLDLKRRRDVLVSRLVSGSPY